MLALTPGPARLRLVPGPLASGEVDGALAQLARAALRSTPVLPSAADPTRLVRSDRAVVLDTGGDDLVTLLTEVLPDLLPSAYGGHASATALAGLGVRRLTTGDVVELLRSLDRPAAWWRSAYAALGQGPVAQDADALGALPVPLADGRVVTGARGLLLPGDDLPAAAAAALGLRVVHPDAVHPLLERLGARPVTARAVLADEAVRDLVDASLDAEDADELADAVLALVLACRPPPW